MGAACYPEPEALRVEAPEQKSAQDLLSAVQEHAMLHTALAKLEPVQRQLIALAFFRGMSHQEIAAHARLPLGSVKTYLRKALAVMRALTRPALREEASMKSSTRQREVLDQAILEQLLLASAPVAPAPDQAAAIKRRVLEGARRERAGAGDNYVTVRSGTGQWIDFLPRVQIKLLHFDGRYNSVLLRMAPGASLPAHSHGGDEECMVLEGEVYLGDIRVKAGDYHLALKGSHHGELRSDTGALLFLRTTHAIAAYARK